MHDDEFLGYCSVAFGPNNLDPRINDDWIQANLKREVEYIELRFDSIPPSEVTNESLSQLRSQLPDCKLIATIRNIENFGNYTGSEKERLALFRKVVRYVDVLDVEFKADEIREEVICLASEFNKKLIVSYHNDFNTPGRDRLEETLVNMAEVKSDHIKYCTRVQNTGDAFRLMDLLSDSPHLIGDKSVTMIGTGAQGSITRLMFPLLGSRLRYCYILGSWNEMLGQISIDDIESYLETHKDIFEASLEDKLSFANDEISRYDSFSLKVA